MRALLAVLVDLIQFALGRDSERYLTEEQTAVRTKDGFDKDLSSKPTGLSEIHPTGQRAYVTEEAVPVLKEPRVRFDTVLGQLPYAEIVGVTAMENGFAHIQTESVSGWVNAEYLSDDKNVLFPQLQPGTVHTAQHENTIKIRKLLRDDLLGGFLRMHLQASEFVLYQMKLSHKQLPWPLDRPRTPGTWHALLRGLSGVTIGVAPRTAAVIEFFGADQAGVIGWVDSVAPDESIKILSVGRFIEGEYRVDTLTSQEWRELRPVFISIT